MTTKREKAIEAIREFGEEDPLAAFHLLVNLVQSFILLEIEKESPNQEITIACNGLRKFTIHAPDEDANTQKYLH